MAGSFSKNPTHLGQWNRWEKDLATHSSLGAYIGGYHLRRFLRWLQLCAGARPALCSGFTESGLLTFTLRFPSDVGATIGQSYKFRSSEDMSLRASLHHQTLGM